MISARVRSSAIREVQYEPSGERLIVIFAKGGSASYLDVPRSVFDAMIRAPSVGRYYRQVVRKRY